MVSPELLRRYPFFAMLDDPQLKAIAMIAQEKSYAKGDIILRENTRADRLMLLEEGDVDLIYSGGGEGAICNALVGSIAPGEILGVSSLVEPYTYVCSARNTMSVKVVEIEAAALRDLMEKDHCLGHAIMTNLAAAILERLKFTQVELAAARA